jgi:hypothetical protein
MRLGRKLGFPGEKLWMTVLKHIPSSAATGSGRGTLAVRVAHIVPKS